jgi:hypothetical protein
VRSRRNLAAAAALLCAAVAAGCGLGPGEKKGEAELLVSRDYGSDVLVGPADLEVRESDTVIGLLDGEADVTTRYGDNFVQSIDGIEGGTTDGRRYDWFFYVNGVESPQGGAEVKPGEGDQIWWDYRDWSTAMRVPAVVGSFPEPFAHGYEGKEPAVRIDCLGERAPCDTVQAELEAEGVEAGIFEADHAPGFDSEAGSTLRIIVGPWARAGEDPAVAQIGEGPEQSGVFARFEGEGAAATLSGFSPTGEQVLGPFDASAGLVAAVRFQDQPPTWVVTGAGPAGIAAAAGAFSAADLEGRFAVIAGAPGTPEPVTPVPVVAEP